MFSLPLVFYTAGRGCWCVYEVLRRGKGSAKEDLGYIFVFILGGWIRGSPGKECATLHRSAAEEEVVGPGKPGEQGVLSVCSLLPGSCSSLREQCSLTASSFSSALPWVWAAGGSAAQALPAPVLRGEKRNPCLQQHHPLLLLGE